MWFECGSNVVRMYHAFTTIYTSTVCSIPFQKIAILFIMAPTAPAAYWILTIPEQAWTPPPTLPSWAILIKGQLETAASGFRHWQVLIRLKNKQRLSGVRLLFPKETHAEPTRSAAALAYVHKEETSVPGTRFELGQVKSKGVDWDAVKTLAVQGQFSEIDSGVMLRCVVCGR